MVDPPDVSFTGFGAIRDGEAQPARRSWAAGLNCALWASALWECVSRGYARPHPSLLTGRLLADGLLVEPRHMPGQHPHRRNRLPETQRSVVEGTQRLRPAHYQRHRIRIHQPRAPKGERARGMWTIQIHLKNFDSRIGGAWHIPQEKRHRLGSILRLVSHPRPGRRAKLCHPPQPGRPQHSSMHQQRAGSITHRQVEVITHHHKTNTLPR